LIDHPPEVAPIHTGCGVVWVHCRRIDALPLARSSPGPVGAGSQSYSISDLVQPAAYRFAPSDCASFACEHHESRLKGILSVVGISEQTPAHAPHQPLMPTHEQLKGRFITLCDEALQQLAIRHFAGGL
jgi:hypothetical protein